MIQYKTITRLFDSYVKKTNSKKELDLLMRSFDTSENERFLKRLIRKELETEYETSPDLTAILSNSYQQIRERIKQY